MSMSMVVPLGSRVVVAAAVAVTAVALAGCPSRRGPAAPPAGSRAARAVHLTALVELNNGACKPGQVYVQQTLVDPMRIAASRGQLATELVVALRPRCVPVWIPDGAGGGRWDMQTLQLRTYGFPRNPDIPLVLGDTDVDSPDIAWSAPGPTLVVDAATRPGAGDGTAIKIRLYNRMPFSPDDQSCVVNVKCNTTGPNAGIDPATGRCKQPIDPKTGGSPPQIPRQSVGGRLIEPPNCFHGLNSTNLHFHGFHVSPHSPQDNVSLELRPPLPPGTDPATQAHAAHAHGTVAYGHYDYAIDPLRYTQPPGTHWYHAHKHGSTALHVLNGQIGTILVRGEFDRRLEAFFAGKGGGPLVDRLLVVQQIQQQQPGLGGADQTGAVLVNGQGNPLVMMKRGEIQRWRFVGATMQASAALRIGFPDTTGRKVPEVRQIAMDGVQLSPDNYACQPFLRNPDCSPPANDSSFDELTAFNLAPGNRIDVLIQAPDTPGAHCLVLDITSTLAEANKSRDQHLARARFVQSSCGNTGGLGPLLTLVVEHGARPMRFPSRDEFPPMASFLADLPPVTDPAQQRDIYYQMVNQGDLPGSQFWINQTKYDSSCSNETLTMDIPQQWTLWNNSLGVAHPFHIHQNPFQLISQSDRGTYRYPVWRDVMPIPTAKTPSTPNPPAAWAPNADPGDPERPWGNAVIRYVAKEFTGGFVNHCHILGHEDRGMMHATQAVCPSGTWATTGPVPPGTRCDAQGFCPGDCQLGRPIPASATCPAPPPQRSDWPSRYGYPPATAARGAAQQP